MTKFTAFVIDDEPMARFNIRDALSSHEDWQLIGEAGNAKQGLANIKTLQPDVVFLDIQMPHISGLQLAKQLVSSRLNPFVVFVTAYDKYAIQAFDLYALDYLLKPFDDERFMQTLNRLEPLIKSPTLGREMYKKDHYDFIHKHPLSRIVIRSTGSIRVIQTKDIEWLATSGNYVEVHHTDGCHLHRGSLKHLLEHLAQDTFCQVHRTAAINVLQARELKSLDEDKYMIKLANGDTVKVSKTFKQVLLEKMGVEL